LIIENKLVQAEEAARRNDFKTFYMIVEDLAGKATPRMSVSGSDGKHLNHKNREHNERNNISLRYP